jgi:hypothetical protein
MPDPIAFDATTTRYRLPLLFSGQAHKEFFVNEALARIDAVLDAKVLGEASDPPEDSEDGDAWLVGPGATGGWEGQEGALAILQPGQWLFVEPVAGMRVFDVSTGQFAHFFEGWQKPTAIAEPTGGFAVDSEARAVIGLLISALRAAGIFPSV